MIALKLFDVYVVYARERTRRGRKRDRYVRNFVALAETKDRALGKVSECIGIGDVEELIAIENEGDVMSAPSEYMSDARLAAIRSEGIGRSLKEA